MKKYFVVILTIALAVALVGCKKKAETEMTEEDVRLKVEKAAMDYAKTDDALGAYDSIKFVGYSPYYKSTYCDLMCQLLNIHRSQLQPQVDSAIDNRDDDALASLSQKMEKIQSCIEYFNKQAYNSLITKEDPVVLYEAKCYSYTDGYVAEYLYYVTKQWKVIELNPYDLEFLNGY